MRSSTAVTIGDVLPWCMVRSSQILMRALQMHANLYSCTCAYALLYHALCDLKVSVVCRQCSEQFTLESVGGQVQNPQSASGPYKFDIVTLTVQ